MKHAAYLILALLIYSCSTPIKTINLSSADQQNSNLVVTFSDSIDQKRIRGFDTLTVSIFDSLYNDLNFNNLLFNFEVLKWDCPNHKKIQAEGIAVGFAGGLVGGVIWGTSNFTDVYGIAKLNVKGTSSLGELDFSINDTISANYNYNSYSTIAIKNTMIKKAYLSSLNNAVAHIRSTHEQ